MKGYFEYNPYTGIPLEWPEPKPTPVESDESYEASEALLNARRGE